MRRRGVVEVDRRHGLALKCAKGAQDKRKLKVKMGMMMMMMGWLSKGVFGWCE